MPLKTHLDEQPALNLTAMLDVMFLLIIFFVLDTKFLDDERQINLAGAAGATAGQTGRRRPAEDHQRLSRRHDHARPSHVTLPELTARLAAARSQAKTSACWCAATARRIPAGGRRAQRLQTGRHQRSGGLRTLPRHEEMSHGSPVTSAASGVCLPARPGHGSAVAGAGRLHHHAGRAHLDALGPYRPLAEMPAALVSGPLLLAGYAATVQIVTLRPARATVCRIALVDGPRGPRRPTATDPAAWSAARRPPLAACRGHRSPAVKAIPSQPTPPVKPATPRAGVPRTKPPLQPAAAVLGKPAAMADAAGKYLRLQHQPAQPT